MSLVYSLLLLFAARQWCFSTICPPSPSLFSCPSIQVRASTQQIQQLLASLFTIFRQWTWIICTQIARSAKCAIWYLTFAWSDNCLNQDLNKVRPNECLYSWVQCFWMRKNWCLRHSQAVSHKENSTIVSHIHVLPMKHSSKASRNKWKKEIVCTLAN